MCTNVNYVKFGGKVIKLTWHYGLPSKRMQTRQVYGVIFAPDGRIMLKVSSENGKKEYSLIGGTTEDFDENMIATLTREVSEEVNTTLDEKIEIIGYQKVEGDGKPKPYAQVRMAAVIKQIFEKRPDIDGGEIYDRLLTTPEKAIKLLNWGTIGKKIIKRAVKIAKKQFNIALCCQKDEYV